MHGVNAELKGHPNKEYKFVFYCGCPGTKSDVAFIKKRTHKKQRRETKKLLNSLTKEIASLGNSHLNFLLATEEEIWTTNMDSC